MGLRIPQNQVVQSKYTAGKEYMFESTYREYQGYYYELNGKTFAGEKLAVDAPVLIPIPKNSLGDSFINKLLTKAATYTYGKISGAKIQSDNPISVVYQPYTTTNRYNNRYFYTKTNLNPIIIKETNEDSFNQLKSNPIYKTIAIQWDNTGGNEEMLEKTDKIFPGIKSFLQNEDPLDDPSL